MEDRRSGVEKVHALNAAIATANALILQLVGDGYRVDVDTHTLTQYTVSRTYGSTSISVDTFRRVE